MKRTVETMKAVKLINKVPWYKEFIILIKNIIKKRQNEKNSTLLSTYVVLLIFIFFEFFVNLVFLPTAITNPIISLFDILQPLQTVFYNNKGILSITLL